LAELGYLAGAPASAFWELKEEWMVDLWQDVRFGFRALTRAPSFTVVAVVTLALGVGANTTVFTLVSGLLFRPPSSIQAPGSLVRIGRGHAPDRFDNWSCPVYRDFRDGVEGYSGVAAFAGLGAVVGTGVSAEAVPAQLVSTNYFGVLGVPLALGRGFTPDEGRAPGEAAVVVISYDLWRQRFGGAADVLGRTLAVNGRPFKVVGVAPNGFGGSDIFRASADIWVPIMMQSVLLPGGNARLENRGSSWLWVVARRAPGVSFERARALTEAFYGRLEKEHNPNLAGQGVWVVPGVGLKPGERADAARLSALLMGIVVLVLLIACANLAGLALARGTGRASEMGVRTAVGASRTRLVRLLLTESLLLASLGGVVGLALTALVAGGLPRLVPFPLSVGFAPDGRVLAFGMALAVAAGVLFGLLPALSASRTGLRETLSAAARSSTPRSLVVRRSLVALQLAMSFLLLAGTGVLVRSLHAAQVSNPGFDADRVAVVSLDLRQRGGYDAPGGEGFYDGLLTRVKALPGVTAAGVIAELPIADFQSNHTPHVPGEPARPEVRQRPVYGNYADAGYFRALGIALEQGRLFDRGDGGARAEPVVVINQTLARRFFADEDPVGRMLPFATEQDGRPARVVGVVADHRHMSLRLPARSVYWVPFGTHYRGDMTVVARTPGDPATLAPRMAAQVQDMDPGMPVLRAATLRQLISGTLRETRMVSALIAIFGLLALSLAVVGLYGAVSYAVEQRTREIGIRIALGATIRDVLSLVLRQGVVVGVVGLAIGLGAAALSLRLLRRLLFGVSPVDPVSLAAGAAVLLGAVLLATLLPARRATRVEPARALNDQ
jgi:predicted permease